MSDVLLRLASLREIAEELLRREQAQSEAAEPVAAPDVPERRTGNHKTLDRLRALRGQA